MLRAMFGMGASEILVILVVALLFLGPEKLPEAASKISKGIRDIRKQTRDLQQTIENDSEIGGAIRDLKSALRGDEIRPRPRAQLQSVPPGTAPPGKPEAATALAAPTSPDAEPAAQDAPSVRIPDTAGEPAEADPASAAVAAAGPDADPAALIRPVVGTIAKGGGEPS
jgi:sec-independent protein translocase protein TatB